MFPLDVLSQSVPAHQVAGRFGVEAMGLLLPKLAITETSTVKLVPYAMLTRPVDIPALLEHLRQRPITRAALRDHLLVFRLQGEFFSTDELSVSQVRLQQGQGLIKVVITHREIQDGEAVPRAFYLALYIEIANQPLRSLELQFIGCQRDFRGNETLLTEPIAMSQYVEISD